MLNMRRFRFRKYINVYNVKDPNKLLSSIDLHSSIVCQKEKYKIILNSDINKCCYYDIKDDSCEDSSFITIYYEEIG